MFDRLYRHRLRRSTIILAASLAVFGGLFWARTGQMCAGGWLIPGCICLVTSWRRHNVLTLCCCIGCCFLIGWWRGGVYAQKLARLRQWDFQTVTVSGVATDDAVYDTRYQLSFELRRVETVVPVHAPLVGELSVKGFGENAIYRGDIVEVTGKLYPTMGNSTASMSFAKLHVLSRGTNRLDALRRRFIAGMQTALPEPLAPFALGLLIGQRSALPDDVNTVLRHVGLTHIIAVSGYNLTILVMACRRVFAGKSKFQTTLACCSLMTGFLLLTGSSPPIVRASVISGLSLCAWYYGRTIRPLVLLAVSAVITVIANPLYAWGNVSWYLSFLAFGGVLLLAPLLTKRIYGHRSPPALVGIVLESACANICVLPYTLFIFGQVSLVSLPANVLVVPLVPLAMALSAVAGVAGMALPLVAGWLAWPARFLLTYMIDCARVLSGVPHAFIQGLTFSWQYMVAAYATIVFVMVVLNHAVRVRIDRQPAET